MIARIIRWVLLASLVVLFTASMLPLIETDLWWVRLFDFPRLQIFAGLIAVSLLCLRLTPSRRLSHAIGAVAVLAALSYHAYKLAPFLPLAPEQAIAVEGCSGDARLTIMIANVQSGNEDAGKLLELVQRSDPDVFLAMETDARWDAMLDRLQPMFSGHLKQVAGADTHFGIHLFSQFPLRNSEVRSLVEGGVPSVFATLELPNGTEADFYGLHPRPPGLFEPSTDRDAQLLIASLEARGSNRPAIIGGDFNAVPWERTYNRMKRIGGLLDPRLGRGFYNTYHAQIWGVAWPLDHVLWQNEFVLLSMQTMTPIGSDHYPLLVELCHLPEAADAQPAPLTEPDDLEEAQSTIRAGRGRSTR